jgi:hypothetical protein
MDRYPANPSDGMIYEPVRGTYLQYVANQHAWVKLKGYGRQLEPATGHRDGLMPKEDFVKLTGLLLPPPHTALTSEDCTFIFNTGTYGFRSSNNDLIIDYELGLQDKDEQGFAVERKEVWKISENTYGLDFKVNIEKMVTELEARGHLGYNKTVGAQGDQGDPGEDGIDNLETGPKGETGPDGANAAFPGLLSAEPADFDTEQDNRGIVDITTERISANENYLVVTRANLGDPDFCPKFVKPQDVDSKWIVVIDERPAVKQILRECETEVCNVKNCAPDQISSIVTQTFCSSMLYYLDISPIETAIRTRFEELLQELKETKEEVVGSWLQTMLTVYNNQKTAMCCAIENCESRRENQRHRERIESLRLQGAIGGVGIKIDCETDATTVVDTDVDKDCPPDEDDQSEITEGVPPDTGVVPEPTIFNLVIGCQHNAPTADRASSVEVPPGRYQILLTDCCCYSIKEVPGTTYPDNMIKVGETAWDVLKDDSSKLASNLIPAWRGNKPYFTEIRYSYQGQSGRVNQTFAERGPFRSKDEAPVFEPVIIDHFGGAISAYFPVKSDLANPPPAASAIPIEGLTTREMNSYLQLQNAMLPCTSGNPVEVLNEAKGYINGHIAEGMALPQNEALTRAIRLLQAVVDLIDTQLAKPRRCPTRIRGVGARDIERIALFFSSYPQAVRGAGTGTPPNPSVTATSGNDGNIILVITQLESFEEAIATGSDQEPSECDESYETSREIKAEENTFTFTPLTFQPGRNQLPNPFEVSSDEPLRPVVMDLPAPGEFEVEITSCCIYDSNSIANFGGGELIVTQTMFTAARTGLDDWIEAWKDSVNEVGHIISQNPFRYDRASGVATGILNDLQDIQARAGRGELAGFQMDTESMRVLAANLMPYSSLITMVYNGFEDSEDDKASVIVQRTSVKGLIGQPIKLTDDYVFVYDPEEGPPQDSERGGFPTVEEADRNFIGEKFRIRTTGGQLALFFDDRDSFQRGLPNEQQPFPNPNKGSASVKISCVPAEKQDCDGSQIEVDIDCSRNNMADAIVVPLDLGEYVAELIGCCCGNNSSYSGQFSIRYDSEDGPTVLTSTSLGLFPAEEEAHNQYINSSISFKNAGSSIRIWANKLVGGATSGVLKVRIQRRECFSFETEIEEGTGATDLLFPDFYCDMPANHIRSYQFSWQTSNCCGFIVEAGSVNWIVVKRSLGNDRTCGGGEGADAPCIRQGLSIGFHPAIAFPTIDGENFLGIPNTGARRMFRDEDLERELRDSLAAGLFKEVRRLSPEGSGIRIPGPIFDETILREVNENLVPEFEAIIFPVEM